MAFQCILMIGERNVSKHDGFTLIGNEIYIEENSISSDKKVAQLFFDAHCDLLYDIVAKRLKGGQQIIQTHLPALRQGNFIGGIWNYYNDPKHPLCDFQQAITLIEQECEEQKEWIQVIRSKSDIGVKDRFQVLLGLEGLYPIRNEEHLEEIYHRGFRHAMLTWNEENQFATGARGDENRGLTHKGRKLIKKMEQLRMILDVSHANEKTFHDIISIVTRPVIASHSNAWEICPHERNLKKEQVKALANIGGLIGVTTVKYFTDPEHPTVSRFVDHIDYFKKIIGIDQIMIGFDFIDYLDGGQNGNLIECPNMAHTNPVLIELEKRKYSTTEIEKIASLNLMKFLKEWL